MLQLMKLAFAICITTSVIIDLCNGQSKARRPRSRNNRRCPSACLRKIKQVELKPGPPGPRGLTGPQGPQGSPGTPGPEGPAITLPACNPGEYLTSDGTNLICKSLDLTGVCSNIKSSCPNDGQVPTGSEASVSKAPGRMVKFMKKNMFQSITRDAWDIEVLSVDGSLFLGLSQLGDASFHMLRWYSNSFLVFQEFKVMGVRNWTPFKIGNDQYFVLSNTIEKACAIFRYDMYEKKFKNQSISLECRRAIDLKAFKIDGVQHIVVPNHEDGHPVVLWMWNGKRFTRRQDINITASYVEVFDVNGSKFLAISGPLVFIYKWDGSKFTYFQEMYMEDRPYEMTAFEAGQDKFLGVSTMGTNTYRIMIWNGQKFQSFQNITSSGARRISAISSPLMGKHVAYLALINYFQNPEIYYWVGGSSTRFEKLQEMEAKAARDMCFFEMDGKMYLLMASRKNIEIFRGELV